MTGEINARLQELHEELERLAPEYALLTPVQQSDLIAMLEHAATLLRQDQEEMQAEDERMAAVFSTYPFDCEDDWNDLKEEA
jgi:hypothetical protein